MNKGLQGGLLVIAKDPQFVQRLVSPNGLGEPYTQKPMITEYKLNQ